MLKRLRSRLRSRIILAPSRLWQAGLLTHANRIYGCECKFVFAGDWSARGNPGAQYLAATAFDFEQFSSACINLLANGAAKTHWVHEAGTVGGQLDGFWTQRVSYYAVRRGSSPGERAAIHGTVG